MNGKYFYYIIHRFAFFLFNRSKTLNNKYRKLVHGNRTTVFSTTLKILMVKTTFIFAENFGLCVIPKTEEC